MSLPRTLVFFGSHPDDETFGPGGTLAQYAAQGARVYYVCATRGEAGAVDDEYLKDRGSAGDVRWNELQCAARVLGLVDTIHLGYRDSGMAGSADNINPQALTAAPFDEVVGRIVQAIRQLKPQVVVTFDPIGGYRHPDHIIIHKATIKAFEIAADGEQYPQAGRPFQAQKLYFSLFPRGVLKVMVRLMPLIGKNPHRLGRNKDIDLTTFANVDFPVHTVIRLNKAAVKARNKAANCHVSQLAGMGPPGRWLFRLSEVILGARDIYMRAYPPVTGKAREHDLFQGVSPNRQSVTYNEVKIGPRPD
jgi:N-acetyl-1-D-myo-inositol-2-amino-2-deoxy-alpha-D-glucopyranoside deacetylase/mycothiol S-conjugate amidase